MIKLKDLPFFNKFPESLVKRLQSCVIVKEFKQGEIILKQGEKNESLYFLLEGRLGVYVDEGLVAQLQTKGDLIGEMSLISELNSSATIKANTDAKVLKLSGEDLHRATSGEGSQAEHNLYKIYSDILVQKLEATNHKAKKLEEFTNKLELAQKELEATNESLEIKVQERTSQLAESIDDLKQKNTELQATHDKITDLYQSRDITFKSLENLLNKNLKPLKQSILKFQNTDKNQDHDMGGVEKEVTRAINRLEPLTASFKSESSMKSQRVLLSEPVKKQQSIAKMALGGTGVELDIVQTKEEAREMLSKNSYDIFMISQDFLDLTDFAVEKSPGIRFVFVTSDDVPDYVPTLLNHRFIPNVVSRDEEDRQFTIKNYVTTVSKLASGNYFGLEKYISWGVEVKQLEVSGSAQRPEIIQEMDEYFANSGVRSSNRGRCSVVAEELLMNAIYDAPRTSDGKPLYNHKDRTEPVELKEAHHATFRFATDGVLMAISIEDPFGGLDARTLFNYLNKCYEGGSLNDGRADKGGGGRGLHQIIENSDLVVFNIDLGKRTEVIALFNTDQKSAPDRRPNLHFFKAS